MKAAHANLALPSQRGVAVARRGQRLFAMRMGWLLIVLVDVALFAASLMARWDQLATPNDAVRANLAGADLSVGFYAGYNIALEVGFAMVFLVVGLLIFWRRSDEPVGILISLMLIMFGMAARPIVP